MKKFNAYLRTIIIVAVSFFLFELFLGTESEMAIEKYPVIWAVLGIVLMFAIAIEVSVAAIRSVMYTVLSPEAKERYDADEVAKKGRFSKQWKALIKALTKTKAIEEEHEIILDHNYDGIKELDNRLPPWWLYGFYITIIFAAIYMVRYHILDGPTSAEEFETEMAEAKLAIEEYKRTAKDLVDVNTVELLTEADELKAGRSIFETNCVACHMADGGGGIGPNLTDEYWILGGGIKNVFRTVSEGGRDGKGMVAWKQSLKPREIAQVSSYLLGFQGTTPANPKEPQGDIWVDPDTEQTEPEVLEETIIDSLSVTQE